MLQFSRMQSPAWSLAGLALLAAGVAGCGKDSNNQPISAANSQFQVADDGDAGGAGPADPAKPGASEGGGPNADYGTGGSDPGEATSPPVDPLANLAVQPESYDVPEGEQELLDFLAKMQQRQPTGQTREDLIQDYHNIQRARVAAAEKVQTVAKTAEVQKTAAQAKLDALRALAQSGDPDAGTQLRTYSNELLENDNPDIASLGRIMMFGMLVDKVAAGQVDDVGPVVEELKKLLAERPKDPGVYAVASQAALLLEQTEFRAEALEALKLVGNSFKDHEDEELASQAATLLNRARIIEVDLQAKIEALMKDEPDAPAAVNDALAKLLDGGAMGAEMLSVASQVAQILEMTGHIEAAGVALEKLDAAFQNNSDPEVVKQAGESVANGRKRLSLPGKPFVLEGTLPDGSPFDWAAYKGKVVLVDFWATWCGPCLAEIPNIKRNYEAFKDQGFEVVGVNLDDEVEAVTHFLSLQPLPWQTVVSSDPEKRGFQHPLAVACGVEAIPFILLIDAEGKVHSMHVRGPKLRAKLTALLGEPAGEPGKPTEPAQPPDEPAKPADADPAKPAAEAAPANDPAPTEGDTSAPAKPEAAAEKPADETSSHSRTAVDAFLAFGADESAPAAEKPAPATKQPAAAAEPPAAPEGDAGEKNPAAEINPYAAAAGLSPAELVDFLFAMLDKPKSIQGRAGFAEALIEAADRILAADGSSDKQKQVAALTKFDLLHAKACLGDDAADTALMEFAKKMHSSTDPKIAAYVAFFETEREVIDVDKLPLAEVPALLDRLTEYFSKTELTARDLRLASSTVHAINRLEDGELREKKFQEFGGLFAKSADKELSRYGKKLAKKSPTAPSELIGKPLELVGVTTAGTEFDWKAYRGKVVLVDFWATWCGPCVREMPNVKALYEKLKDRSFDIVGVSLDRDPEALAKFLEENEIPWTNLSGEENNELAQKYGVRGIPTMMLVDRDGNIVAVSHKVDEVAAKAEELLGNEKTE